MATRKTSMIEAAVANDLDYRTIIKVTKSLGSNRKRQTVTKARKESIACPPKAFHRAASCLTTMGKFPSFKKWNMDASGVQVKCLVRTKG